MKEQFLSFLTYLWDRRCVLPAALLHTDGVHQALLGSSVLCERRVKHHHTFQKAKWGSWSSVWNNEHLWKAVAQQREQRRQTHVLLSDCCHFAIWCYQCPAQSHEFCLPGWHKHVRAHLCADEVTVCWKRGMQNLFCNFYVAWFVWCSSGSGRLQKFVFSSRGHHLLNDIRGAALFFRVVFMLYIYLTISFSEELLKEQEFVNYTALNSGYCPWL